MTPGSLAAVDHLIIGGGVAGVTLAAHLAERVCGGADGAAAPSVLLLEAEPVLAHHTSGRSAQQLIPSYGPDAVRELTRLTLQELDRTQGVLEHPVVWPSAFLMAGTEEQVQANASGAMQRITLEELARLAPELRPGRFAAAGLDTTAVRSDAPRLIQWHAERARTAGAKLRTGARVTRIAPLADGGFEVSLEPGSTGGEPERIRAHTVVNAAGAWAGHVAALAGAAELDLTPLRRTAAVVTLAEPLDPAHPMVDRADEAYYYRREGEHLLISPSEAVPSPAEDAQPVMAEVEAVIELIRQDTTLQIQQVQRAWTGLRTESPDGVPVVGPDPQVPGLFWLAGQSGYGFQTCSALARVATDLLVDGAVGDWCPAWAAEALAPARFSAAGTAQASAPMRR